MSAVVHLLPIRITHLIAGLMRVNGVARAAQSCARIGIPMATCQAGLDVYYRQRRM